MCWKGNWTGKRVRDLVDGDLPEDTDCYFCPALLREGATTRSNANAERVHVLVIDDVGTKISREGFDMFGPEPSYWLETSPDNYQAGFLIGNGCTPAEYVALRKSMKSHAIWGHADGVDPVHLFRLPQGINTKPKAGGWKVTL